MYRAMEAHTVTLLALYSLKNSWKFSLMKKLSRRKHPLFWEKLITKTSMKTQNTDITSVTLLLKQLTFLNPDTFQKIKQSESTTNKIQRYIGNYINFFETILKFGRSTRQRDLLLHMQCLESLMKYFFAHDHLNHARRLPLYISTMQQKEHQHPEIWAGFMKGNVCVTKGVVGFTSIGPDHEIEQENRELKVI